MKMHLFGVALICVAPSYLGQSAQSIETPPPHGKTMTWVPQERATTWEAEQRDGYLLGPMLEKSAHVGFLEVAVHRDNRNLR